MHDLALHTFLDGYVRRLSLCGSGRVRELAREVESRRNHRLLEPLVVLAVVTGRTHLLEREAVPGGMLRPELDLMATLPGPAGLVELLREPVWDGSGPLRAEYYKVWEAYRNRALAADDGLVRYALRERAMRAREASDESYYAMARATGLNGGAVWDALARGNVKRLSRASLERLVEHAEAEAGRQAFLSPADWPGFTARYHEAFPAREPRVGTLAG